MLVKKVIKNPFHFGIAEKSNDPNFPTATRLQLPKKCAIGLTLRPDEPGAKLEISCCVKTSTRFRQLRQKSELHSPFFVLLQVLLHTIENQFPNSAKLRYTFLLFFIPYKTLYRRCCLYVSKCAHPSFYFQTRKMPNTYLPMIPSVRASR